MSILTLGAGPGGDAPPPTDVFSFNVAGVIQGGYWGTPAPYQGETITQVLGGTAVITFVAHGTTCNVRIYNGSELCTWTVDGGAPQTAFAPGDTNLSWFNVFSGLSDGPHTVVFNNNSYVGYENCLQISGSSPAVTAPTGFTNNILLMNSSGMSADNAVAAAPNSGLPLVQQRGIIRFKATTTTLRLWCLTDTSTSIGLVVDSDVTGLVRQNLPTGWNWVSFTGLDATEEHQYRIVIDSHSYFYSVMAGDGTFNTTPLTPWGSTFFFGDSITAGSNIANGDEAPNYPQVYCLLANCGEQINAIAGQTAYVYGQANDTAPGDSVPQPATVMIGFGYNDQADEATTLEQWTTAVTNIMTTITTALPDALVYWFGIIPVPGSLTNRPSYNTALQSAIAALANANAIYAETDTCVSPTTPPGTAVLPTGDGVTHPNAAGALQLGTFLAANYPPT